MRRTLPFFRAIIAPNHNIFHCFSDTQTSPSLVQIMYTPSGESREVELTNQMSVCAAKEWLREMCTAMGNRHPLLCLKRWFPGYLVLQRGLNCPMTFPEEEEEEKEAAVTESNIILPMLMLIVRLTPIPSASSHGTLYEHQIRNTSTKKDYFFTPAEFDVAKGNLLAALTQLEKTFSHLTHVVLVPTLGTLVEDMLDISRTLNNSATSSSPPKRVSVCRPEHISPELVFPGADPGVCHQICQTLYPHDTTSRMTYDILVNHFSPNVLVPVKTKKSRKGLRAKFPLPFRSAQLHAGMPYRNYNAMLMSSSRYVREQSVMTQQYGRCIAVARISGSILVGVDVHRSVALSPVKESLSAAVLAEYDVIVCADVKHTLRDVWNT
eukprot:PhF_6_TR960/c0_g1_i1/m.1812